MNTHPETRKPHPRPPSPAPLPPYLSFSHHVPPSLVTSHTALRHRLHLYHIRTTPPSPLVHHAVSPLPPDVVRTVGLPPPSIICVSRSPAPAASAPRALTPAAYAGNTAYADFVRRVVANNAPNCSRSGAGAVGAGEVFVIDGRCVNPAGHVAARDILGAFSVGETDASGAGDAGGRGGAFTTFSPNHGHQVLTRDGPTRVDDWMHQRLLEELLTVSMDTHSNHRLRSGADGAAAETGKTLALNIATDHHQLQQRRHHHQHHEQELGEEPHFEPIVRSVTDLEYAYTAHPVWGERLERPFKSGGGAAYRVRSKLVRTLDSVRGTAASMSLTGTSACLPRVASAGDKKSRIKLKRV